MFRGEGRLKSHVSDSVCSVQRSLELPFTLAGGIKAIGVLEFGVLSTYFLVFGWIPDGSKSGNIGIELQ